MSTPMKPTPGPWIVVVRQSSLFETASVVVINSVTGEIVAVCSRPQMNVQTSMANAALMAIAPDMLEALIAIQETAIANINGVMEANPVAALIFDILEKLVNEAGLEA